MARNIEVAAIARISSILDKLPNRDSRRRVIGFVFDATMQPEPVGVTPEERKALEVHAEAVSATATAGFGGTGAPQPDARIEGPRP